MSALGEILAGLMGHRPRHLQVGAICLRRRKGALQVLLISSLGTGRWIIPKGWPMKGRSLAGAAAQEAWEEAGLRGRVSPEPLGSYTYLKLQEGGVGLRCEVRVYTLETETLAEHFPEAGRRERIWVSPAEAAERVAEEGLRALLRALHE